MVINCLTIAGMITVMFYLNWEFTLMALSVVPALFLVIYSYTRNQARIERSEKKEAKSHR